MTGIEVRRHDETGELVGDVASAFLALLEQIQGTGRIPSVALTGGTIADVVHREIARRAEDAAVDWSRVDLWWGDERYVPADSPDRNAGQARAAMLDRLPVDPERVHEMPADDGTPLDQAASRYATELSTHLDGDFDLVMLGMGPDGHVASLFPGHPAREVTDRTVVGVPDSPKPPPARLTLTLPRLHRTARIWYLVSGPEKAEAVARLLDTDPVVPTTLWTDLPPAHR